MEIFKFTQGKIPLLVSVPHAGVHVPNAIAANMTDVGRASVDSDRHVGELYDFALEMGASMIVATHSRYVVDLNRPSDDKNLYPGQDTTGLCPINSFSRDPVYQDGCNPDSAEIIARISAYWKPYHDKLDNELKRLKSVHGYALLWDAHSIKSKVPRFFEGRLPDLNFGTVNGKSCGAGIGEALLETAQKYPDFTSVLNGRFKGGHITRHYGDPSEHIHAVQLELSQITYMVEDAPFNYRTEYAKNIQEVLKDLLARFVKVI